MDRKLARRREGINLKSEAGYLMLSTLFLLMLSGIMLQGIIKISTNHIIQLNQITKSYQEKTALNLAKKILADKIVTKPKEDIKEVLLLSSAGVIQITKMADNEYQFILTDEKGKQLIKTIDFHNFTDKTLKEETEEKEINKVIESKERKEALQLDKFNK
ncbi:MAG: hypothetical protein L0I93_07425 [Atopostipes suicloacalis]|nr:hypothetical protein [Atopostipes suicloacalis]